MAAGVLLAPNEGVPPPAGANANGDDPVLVACAEKLKPPEEGGVGAAKLNPVLGPEEPNGVVIALAKREKEKWLIHGGKFTEVIRDFKIQRRGRQRERQKKPKGLISKTTTLHVHHAFSYTYISFLFLHGFDAKMPNFAF